MEGVEDGWGYSCRWWGGDGHSDSDGGGAGAGGADGHNDGGGAAGGADGHNDGGGAGAGGGDDDDGAFALRNDPPKPCECESSEIAEQEDAIPCMEDTRNPPENPQ